MTGAAPAAPRFQWGHFCDHFLVDGAGKHSFIGVFERIGAITFPATHKTMWIACSVRGEPSHATTALVTIWTPDDTILLSTPDVPVQFSSEGRAVLVHLIYDVVFAGPGMYSVIFEVAGRPTGHMELEVYQVVPPGPPPLP